MSTRAPITKTHERGTVGRVADRAVDCLRSGVGYSLIRLGDGEGRLLAYPKQIARQRLNNHLRYWFGRADFSGVDVDAMQSLLVQSIDSADAIGCNRDASRPWLSVVWQHVVEAGAEGRVCGEKNLHRKLWVSGELDRIAAEAERIVIVTCRDVLVGLGARYRKRIDWVEIPEEGNTGKHSTDHWQRFAEIEHEVGRLSGPHVLALVGAGLLGKPYTTTAAFYDAVALDIGSVFDGWAGIVSRSYLSNGESYEL